MFRALTSSTRRFGTTMRAIRGTPAKPLGRGVNPETIAPENGVPIPEPSPGAVLVKVAFASVNRADLLQRRGLYPPPRGVTDILGLDYAGRIAARAVTGKHGRMEWNPVDDGPEVFGIVPGGGYAEYVSTPETCCVPVPRGLGLSKAAAAAETFFTAHQVLSGAIRGVPRFRSGQSILIHAATGGVGTALIGLAHAAGAHDIVATGRDPERLDMCLAEGATATVAVAPPAGGDRGSPVEFADAVLERTSGRGVDLVVDFIGAPYHRDNVRSLRADTGGSVVSLALMGGAKTQVDLAALMTRNIVLTGSTLRGRPLEYKEALTASFVKDVAPLLATGTCEPSVWRVFPWEQAEQAHEAMGSNAHFGKVVLAIDGEAGHQ